MNVRDLGEFGLIDRLAARLGVPHLDSLLVGIGDDAAAWRVGNTILIATTDTLVDGVHFLSDRAAPDVIGWKAIAANVSDINAMGAAPSFALITLGLPPDTAVAWVDGVYTGIAAAAARFGGAVVGGDIVRSTTVMISVAMVGHAPWRRDWRRALLLRSAARVGDVIAVTNTLGGAAGGLAIVLGQRDAPEPHQTALLAAHYRPDPPVGVGTQLVARGVRCAMDLSDGLAGDLPKICAASGVGATVDLDRLPTHPALRAMWPADAARIAAQGGEDYELLFTAPTRVWRRLQAAGLPATAIGRITAGPDIVYLHGDGAPLTSWDHLR